jgi:FkbM family methyltransferase
MHQPDLKSSYIFLGTEYGGWPLLKSTPARALVYSFGLGEDISFDLGAIERFGCIVHGFDPTPKSRHWVEAQQLPLNFIFHPIGIADHDGDTMFFAPSNENHVSFSANLSDGAGGRKRAILAPTRRLPTLVAELQTRLPDVVKIDIEGFEYDVIVDLLRSDFRPAQLLIEFHHGAYGVEPSRTRDSVDQLRAAGYGIFFVSSSGREYGFTLRETI